MIHDIAEKILFVAGMLVIAITIAFLCAAALDITQSVRAETKEIACRVQHMDHVRQSFSANVTCVPFQMRQDTLTIKK